MHMRSIARSCVNLAGTHQPCCKLATVPQVIDILMKCLRDLSLRSLQRLIFAYRTCPALFGSEATMASIAWFLQHAMGIDGVWSRGFLVRDSDMPSHSPPELDGRLSRSRDRHVLAHVPSRWSAVAGPVGTLSFTLRLKKRIPIDISHARRLDRLLANSARTRQLESIGGNSLVVPTQRRRGNRLYEQRQVLPWARVRLVLWMCALEKLQRKWCAQRHENIGCIVCDPNLQI